MRFQRSECLPHSLSSFWSAVAFVVLLTISFFPYRPRYLKSASTTFEQSESQDIASTFKEAAARVHDEITDRREDGFITTSTDIKDMTHKTETMTEGRLMFYKAVELAYEEAAAPVANLTRRKFDLETWPHRKTGGLSDADRQLLGDMYFKAESLFEFGLGESTYIAAAVGVPRYAGIDSDATWVAQARNTSKMGHFRFYFADIGETKPWGHPVTKWKKNSFDYQLAALSSEMKPFDFYLVDGRYRVASAAACFLHAASLGANMSHVLVGVHDQDAPLRGYNAAITPIAKKVMGSDRLFVYQLRDTISLQDVFQVWKQHRHASGRR